MTDYLALAKRMDDMYHLDQPPEEFYAAADAIRAQAARIAELEAALNGLMVYGCPACNGDCSAATPPVIGCPMEAARAAYRGEKE